MRKEREGEGEGEDKKKKKKKGERMKSRVEEKLEDLKKG